MRELSFSGWDDFGKGVVRSSNDVSTKIMCLISDLFSSLLKIENDDDCLNCFVFFSVFQNFALGAWSLLCHSMHRHFPVCPMDQNIFISETDQGLSSKTLL